MNEEELNKRIKEYYTAQELSEASVQRIVGKAPRSSKRAWWSYWLPVAAAAVIVMALSFQLGRNYEEEEIYFDVAGEVAMRHNRYTQFDVRSASFEEVQSGLRDLAFSVKPLVKEKLLSAYEILGARYCQLKGQQAAHLQVRDRRTGALCTLYIASLKGPLASLKDADGAVDLESNHVELWEDSDRLFALVD